jgi:hypothetical protein
MREKNELEKGIIKKPLVGERGVVFTIRNGFGGLFVRTFLKMELL